MLILGFRVPRKASKVQEHDRSDCIAMRTRLWVCRSQSIDTSTWNTMLSLAACGQREGVTWAILIASVPSPSNVPANTLPCHVVAIFWLLMSSNVTSLSSSPLAVTISPYRPSPYNREGRAILAQIPAISTDSVTLAPSSHSDFVSSRL